MLKQQGFSLFEMLLVLALSSILILTIIQFFPIFQRQWLSLYQKQYIMHIVNNTLLPFYKDIKRAGFMAKINSQPIVAALQVNPKGDCIIIHYDLNRKGIWAIDEKDPSKVNTFVYRYAKHNVEYRSGVPNCGGIGWEKLFDNKEINIIQFQLFEHQLYLEIKITGTLVTAPNISYSLSRIIRYENR
jgi:prepilin peptidase dependent protein B